MIELDDLGQELRTLKKSFKTSKTSTPSGQLGNKVTADENEAGTENGN